MFAFNGGKLPHAVPAPGPEANDVNDEKDGVPPPAELPKDRVGGDDNDEVEEEEGGAAVVAVPAPPAPDAPAVTELPEKGMVGFFKPLSAAVEDPKPVNVRAGVVEAGPVATDCFGLERSKAYVKGGGGGIGFDKVESGTCELETEIKQ